MKKLFVIFVAAMVALVTPMVSFAQTATNTGPDFSTLTSQIDLSTTITAIMAIGVSAMGLLLAIKGVKIVWRMFKGA